MKTLLLLLATACPICAQEQQNGPKDKNNKGLLILPIQDLLLKKHVVQTPPLRSLLSHRQEDSSVYPTLTIARAPEVLTADDLVEMLHTLVSPELQRALEEDLTLSPQGGRLFVAGETRLLPQVATALKRLRRAFTRRVHLQAKLYRLANTRVFPAFATADELGPLLQGLPLLWRGKQSCRTDECAHMGQSKKTSYIHAADTEVAENASGANTVIGSIFEGIELKVDSHLLAGGSEAALFCHFAIGERISLKKREQKISELPATELPLITASTGVFSGRIKSGGAMLVTLARRAGLGKGLLLVIQATVDPQENQRTKSDILPISGLTNRALQQGITEAEPAEFGNALGWSLPIADELRKGPAIGGDLLIELLQTQLPQFEQENYYLRLAAGHLVVTADDATRKRVRAFVVAMQDRILRNNTVQVVTRTLDAPADGQTLAQLPATNEQGPIQRAVVLPSLNRRLTFVTHGRETTAVHNSAIDIAQQSVLHAPQVQKCFAGLIAAIIPTPIDRNRNVAEWRIIHREFDIRDRPLRAHAGADLHLPNISRAVFRHAGPVAVGKPIELGIGPTVRSKSAGLQQTVTTVRLD